MFIRRFIRVIRVIDSRSPRTLNVNVPNDEAFLEISEVGEGSFGFGPKGLAVAPEDHLLIKNVGSPPFVDPDSLDELPPPHDARSVVEEGVRCLRRGGIRGQTRFGGRCSWSLRRVKEEAVK